MWLRVLDMFKDESLKQSGRFYGRLIVDLGQSRHGFQGTKMLSLPEIMRRSHGRAPGPSPLAPDGSGRAFREFYRATTRFLDLIVALLFFRGFSGDDFVIDRF